MRNSIWWVLATVCGSVACGQSNDHANNLDPHFGSGGYIGGGASGGASGAAGAAGAACTADPTLGTELSGNVIVYDAKFAEQPHPVFPGKALLRISGVPCGFEQAIFDGSAPPSGDAGFTEFTLLGAKPSKEQWIHIAQQDTTEAVYPTLIKVDTSNSLLDVNGTNQFAAFGLFRSTEIDAIYTALGLTWDQTKATVIASVGDGGALLTAAGTPAVAQGATWVAGNTADSSGIVALLNVEALPFPGSSFSFNTTGGTQDSCHVEAGAVTACWIVQGFAPP